MYFFILLSSLAGKSDIWGALRKQLREFTLNTQQQLEQERARLLSENHVLKEQLKESQQYIDSHLARLMNFCLPRFMIVISILTAILQGYEFLLHH